VRGFCAGCGLFLLQRERKQLVRSTGEREVSKVELEEAEKKNSSRSTRDDQREPKKTAYGVAGKIPPTQKRSQQTVFSECDPKINHIL
jgi:hypothetical protein